MTSDPQLTEEQLDYIEREVERVAPKDGKGLVIYTPINHVQARKLIALARKGLKYDGSQAQASDATGRPSPPQGESDTANKQDLDRELIAAMTAPLPSEGERLPEGWDILADIVEAQERNEKCEPCGANPYEDCPRFPCEYPMQGLVERLRDLAENYPVTLEIGLEAINEAAAALELISAERDVARAGHEEALERIAALRAEIEEWKKKWRDLSDYLDRSALGIGEK